MKNITLLKLKKYINNDAYHLIENDIYQDLSDSDSTCYRVAISYELEGGDDSQYPLEDILDKFYLHISDFLDEENANTDNLKQYLELAGELKNIRSAISEIIGKRVFKKNVVGENGKNYAKLIIE